MSKQVEYAARVKQHTWAFTHPHPGFESAISAMVNGLIAYREVYAARYKVEVSQDPCLGSDWLSIARGIIGLLDGDTDRFDCPTVDGLIRATAEQAGFKLSLKAKR